jgi:hypothetical protein
MRASTCVPIGNHSAAVRGVVLVLISCGALALSSCVGIAPRAKKQLNVAGNTIKADHGFIVDGKTTRAEIAAHLKDVEVDINDPDLFIGRWKTTTAVYWYLTQTNGDAGSLWRTRTLWVEFNHDGVVREHALISFGELLRRLDQWYLAHPPTTRLAPYSIEGVRGGRFSHAESTAQFLPNKIVFTATNHKKDFAVAIDDVEAIKPFPWFGDDATAPPFVAIHFKKSAASAHTILLRVDIQGAAQLFRYIHAQRSLP